MMKIKLLTYCDEVFDGIGMLSIPILRRYCATNKIDFLLYEKLSTQHQNVYWNKIGIVKENLKEADWVIWCDADILINKFDFDWSHLLDQYNDKNFLVSSDFNGLCLGFFALRVCPWSIWLLETMEQLGDIKLAKVGIYHKKFQREQDTIKVLADFFDAIQTKIHLLPETIVANPRSEQSAALPFAFHFWASRGTDVVQKEMSEYLQTTYHHGNN